MIAHSPVSRILRSGVLLAAVSIGLAACTASNPTASVTPSQPGGAQGTPPLHPSTAPGRSVATADQVAGILVLSTWLQALQADGTPCQTGFLSRRYSTSVKADPKGMDPNAVTQAVVLEGKSPTLSGTWTVNTDSTKAKGPIGSGDYTVPAFSLSGSFEIRHLSVISTASQPLATDQDNGIVWRGEVDVKATWHADPASFDNSPYSPVTTPAGFNEYTVPFTVAVSNAGGQPQLVGDNGSPTELAGQPGCGDLLWNGSCFLYMCRSNMPLKPAGYKACVAAGVPQQSCYDDWKQYFADA